MTRIIHCPNCNQEKQHYAHGLCSFCYYKRYYAQHNTREKEYLRIYRKQPDVRQRINQQRRERYATDPVFREKTDKRTRKYQQRSDVRQRVNQRKRERYATDKAYRDVCRKKSLAYKKRTQYDKKRAAAEKLGDATRIKKLCLRHGFTPDVAEAIALNGTMLDTKMRERGII